MCTIVKSCESVSVCEKSDGWKRKRLDMGLPVRASADKTGDVKGIFLCQLICRPRTRREREGGGGGVNSYNAAALLTVLVRLKTDRHLNFRRDLQRGQHQVIRNPHRSPFRVESLNVVQASGTCSQRWSRPLPTFLLLRRGCHWPPQTLGHCPCPLHAHQQGLTYFRQECRPPKKKKTKKEREEM